MRFVPLVLILAIACTPKPEVSEEPQVAKEKTIEPKVQDLVGDAKYTKLSGQVNHKRKDKVVWEESELSTPLFIKERVKTSGD